MLFRVSIPLALSLLIGCGESAGFVAPDAGAPDSGIPDGGLPDGGGVDPTPIIVDADWLKARLDDPDLQLIDTRSSGFAASRIPGAIPLAPFQLAATVDGVPDQIRPPADAEPVLRAAGLRNDTVAVVYGTGPEYDPARIVWALRYYRHGEVAYLDGGFNGWIESEGEVDSGPPDITPSEYTIPGVDEALRVTGAWVLEQLGDAPYDMPAVQLVDARSDGEYAAGRIPTALSVDWRRNLNAGFLRAAEELQALYGGLDPSTTTVTYCQSGLRGAFAWLTLTALGYGDVRLYDGSWNEWDNGELPVEQ